MRYKEDGDSYASVTEYPRVSFSPHFIQYHLSFTNQSYRIKVVNARKIYRAIKVDRYTESSTF